MDKHTKGLLPTDEYHATIRQNYEDEDTGELVLCWTIDCGQHTWRNLINRFDPESQHDMLRLNKIAKSLNFDMFEPDHIEFFDQWLGLRALLKVTVDLSKDSVFKRNIILEYRLPERPPETDVLAEKDSTHFHENKKGRDLPI